MSPISSPSQGEDKNKFIGRCISELSKIDTDKPAEQVQAICYSKWRETTGEQDMTSSTIPTGKKEIINSLNAVPLFKTGKQKGKEFSESDMQQMKDNTNALINAGIIKVPATPGHISNFMQPDKGAIGWMKRVYSVGNQLFGDFINVDPDFYDAILERKYDNTSIELEGNFEHPETKENIGYVIKAVAFLGEKLPAVKGMGSIMLHSEQKNKNIFEISFSEQILQEEKQMSVWTLKEIEKMFPCCVERVMKFMEDKKIIEIEQNDLAMLIQEVRIESFKEKFADNKSIVDNVVTDKKECPPGFEWNEEKGICLPGGQTEVKAGEQVICPKGYALDDKTGKCVIVAVEKSIQPAEKSSATIPSIIPVVPEKKLIEKEMSELSDEEKAGLKSDYDKLSDEEKKKYENMQEDARPPKGWFDSCVSAVGDKADNPQALCGWIYAHQLGPEAKAKAETTRQSEQEAQKMSEEKLATEKKTNELLTKIKELEKDKMKQIFSEFKEKERDILIPALDPYLDSFYMYFSEKNETIKFAEKDENILDLFIKFLKNLANGKRIIFGELTKSYNPKDINEEGTKMEAKEYKFSEEDGKKATTKWEERYSEQLTKTDAIGISNVELAELSESIAAEEKIDICTAQIKASKILKGLKK